MAYDDAQYNVHQRIGPIYATFASAAFAFTTAGAVGAVAYTTATSANITDRLEFFRNIKLTGIHAIVRTMGMVAKKIVDHAFKVLVFDGTAVVGSCALGTVAGVGTTGGVSATPTIDAGDELQIKCKGVSDGTAGTSDSIAADIYLEYQNRLA